MTQLFGTDGIRGKVGDAVINPQNLLKLGWAIGQVFSKHPTSLVLIGKDTRISGYMLESALQAGLCASGMHVSLLGPMPTPAVAYLTHTLRAAVGIMISASHNSYEDNGVKFFDADGYKLSLAQQQQIEEVFHQPMQLPQAANIGKVSRVHGAPGRYIELCKSKFPYHLSLRSLKIVLDCAQGATYHIAPAVFRELGAEVIVLNAQPNGTNINERCGSTHPESLQKAVIKHKAHAGFAFDGDGDRVIVVNEQGKLHDGDDILFLLASYNQKPLKGVVSTVYCNSGLEEALLKKNIRLHRTPVGDKHVMAALHQKQWCLGGEPSGHVVNIEKTLSGDGIVSALMVLTIMLQQQKTLTDLIQYTKHPSVMINIPCAQPIERIDSYQEAMQASEILLGNQGRIILRASGTEPKLRLFIEARDKALIHKVAQVFTDHPSTSDAAPEQFQYETT